MNARDSEATLDCNHNETAHALPSRMAEPVGMKQISAFLALVEWRSITKAAEQLNMSQSGFSRLISSLETVMGEKLFVRLPSGLSLSANGHALLPYAHKLQTQYVDAIAGTRSGVCHTKVLTVACADLIFSKVLPSFTALNRQDAQGGLRWRVVGMNSAQVINKVQSGLADYGLCMNLNTANGLNALPLLNAPLGLLTEPSMNLPSAFTSLAALNHIPMARLSERNMLHSLLSDRVAQLSGYFDAPVVADTMASLFTAVRGGGLATIVSGIAAALPGANGLRFTPLPQLLPSIQLLLVSRKNPQQTPSEKKLIQQIGETVQQLTWSEGLERAAID